MWQYHHLTIQNPWTSDHWVHFNVCIINNCIHIFVIKSKEISSAILTATRWPRVTDRPMTAGATEENADLGRVAAWTHSTSWNVTAISTNRAWYRYTPAATWRRVSGVLSVIVGHYLFFSDCLYLLSSFTPVTWQTILSSLLYLSYFLSPSIHPSSSCCFITFSHTHFYFHTLLLFLSS